MPRPTDGAPVFTAYVLPVPARDVHELLFAAPVKREGTYRPLLERVVSGWRLEGSGRP